MCQARIAPILSHVKTPYHQIPNYNSLADMNDYLVVNEIFFSIQGESSYSGRPCAFVRLAYCNLRCTYCDTEYAFYEGQKLSLEDVVERLPGGQRDLL